MFLIGSLSVAAQNVFIVIGNGQNEESNLIASHAETVKSIYDLEIIMMTYYSSDPNQTLDSKNWVRSNGLSPYPSFVINGKRFGLMLCEDTLAYIEQRIAENLRIQDELNIQFVNRSHPYYPDGFYDLTLYVRGNTQRNIKVYTCLIENTILRKMHPDWRGIPIDMRTNKTETVNLVFQSTWGEDLKLVLFIQDTNTGEVIASRAENINEILKLGVNEMSKNELRVYPNPFDNELNVQGKFKQLIVFNQIGMILYKGNATRIDLSFLPTGIYFARFDNGRTLKLIKE